MFEARLVEGRIFKQLIEAMKDLVQDANIDCTEDELSIQAMDSSHVSLVGESSCILSFSLSYRWFSSFECIVCDWKSHDLFNIPFSRTSSLLHSRSASEHRV